MSKKQFVKSCIKSDKYQKNIENVTENSLNFNDQFQVRPKKLTFVGRFSNGRISSDLCSISVRFSYDFSKTLSVENQTEIGWRVLTDFHPNYRTEFWLKSDEIRLSEKRSKIV
jgi:hypothetical protein